MSPRTEGIHLFSQLPGGGGVLGIVAQRLCLGPQQSMPTLPVSLEDRLSDHL